MTEQGYLQHLERNLKSLPPEEVADIMRDTREHFANAKAEGRSEQDIIRSLGEPAVVANEYLANSLVQRMTTQKGLSKKSIILFQLMKLVFIVAPLNFFLLIGPFSVFFILLVTFWIVIVTLMGATLTGALWYIATPAIGVAVDIWSHITVISSLLAILFAFLAVAVLLFKGTEWSLRSAAAYVRWNIKFVTET